MSTPQTRPTLLLLTTTLFLLLLHTRPTSSATETFVFGGCSNLKYPQSSTYETTLNSLLTSLVNSAPLTYYNNFTLTTPDTISALYQCRGDLSSAACGRCVARAVSQLGTICLDSCGGALQLEGCFVKYDNVSFLGVEDKTVVVKKCGPVNSEFNSDELNRRDSVLGYLSSGGSFRVGGSGNVNGVGQCVGDLSPSECQDCLSEAINRVKSDCGAAKWGDMYLAKCYVRYSIGGRTRPDHDEDNNDEEIEKTLAILIGLIAGVALLIIFLSCLRRLCEKGKGGK